MDLLDHLRGVLYEKLLAFFSLGLPRVAGPRARSTCCVGCWMPRAISRASMDEVECLRTWIYLSMQGEAVTVLSVGIIDLQARTK